MSEVFRIIDRFKITGRGIVYTVEIPKCFTVCVGDILFDLRGNRFKVKGIEMFRRIPDGKSIEDMPVGLHHAVKEYVNVLDFIGNYEKAGRAPFLLNGGACIGERTAYDYSEIEYVEN